MMKKSLTLIFLLCSIVSFAQNTTGTMTDARDGKVYKTVVIGNQTWMAENLNVSTFRNGDSITEIKRADGWVETGRNDKPAWCYYDNDPKNGLVYGKLYNWYAINDSRGITPEGWHIPTKEEWDILISHLGRKSGKRMKSQPYGNNNSRFSALPAGKRGQLFEKALYAGFWTITESDDRVAYCIYIPSVYNPLIQTTVKYIGFSVRCIKD
jgi:uncharacterized protein (TIGR02145 family)